MEMVILKDGRRGLFSKELMTIKTLELWEGIFQASLIT